MSELASVDERDAKRALRARVRSVAARLAGGDDSQHELFVQLVEQHGAAARAALRAHYDRLCQELGDLGTARAFAERVGEGDTHA
jgi:hypothetical protein